MCCSNKQSPPIYLSTSYNDGDISKVNIAKNNYSPLLSMLFFCMIMLMLLIFQHLYNGYHLFFLLDISILLMFIREELSESK